ncbi:MAG: hypothetical protein HZA34_02270 [Candidatus Pacebacteria bacterium]|nr:hypothetical protein [Candidatus Paceibacterota bacterium]
MTFLYGGRKETWKVIVDTIHQQGTVVRGSGDTPMIIQNDPENIGYEITGFCVELISSETITH